MKDTLEQVHRQMKNREKVFAMFEMDKGPILKLSQGIPTKHGEIGTARENGVRETRGSSWRRKPQKATKPMTRCLQLSSTQRNAN